MGSKGKKKSKSKNKKNKNEVINNFDKEKNVDEVAVVEEDIYECTLSELELFELKEELEIKERKLKIAENSFRTLKEEVDKQEAEILKKQEKLAIKESELNKKEKELEVDINELTTNHIEDVKEKITEEFNLREESLKNHIKAKEDDLAKQIEDLENAKGILYSEKVEIQEKKIYVEAEKKYCEAEKIKFEAKKQEEMERISQTEQVKSLNRIIENSENEMGELRDNIENLIKDNNKLERIRTIYGEDADVFVSKYESLKKQLDEANNQLAERPTSEMKTNFEQLQKENLNYQTEIANLRNSYNNLVEENYYNNVDELKVEVEKSNFKISNLESLIEELEYYNKNQADTIKRLTTKESYVVERSERISDIEKPIIVFDTEDGKYYNDDDNDNYNEIEWLRNIEEKCKECDIIFPRRILYAYHTALKISDWSPITVLSGISGTGKSELPRLYAMFGGINFINISVQPNWDDQDSMLGFFNSVDNKFNVEPALRYLTQCSNDLKDYVSIFLLDEMNLAHVEHYFANFLSKLEERRGKTIKNIPYIEIDLGAGIEPYRLELRRNILYTGTINQDETTKTLSDKVIDRGIIINFPRPTKLNSRKKMTNIDSLKNEKLLPYEVWVGNKDRVGWVKRELVFSKIQNEKINEFKEIVEEINKYLGVVGCAVGHRVWQSIEYYIANYPTVIAFMESADGELTVELEHQMHIAFEDQIVQKIMPKLRGIDTTGKSKSECLDKIKKLLEDNDFNLSEDFETACSLGYGQFVWSSANYINSDDNLYEADIQNIIDTNNYAEEDYDDEEDED